MKTKPWQLITLLIFATCAEDMPDCPSKMCVLTGGWRLAEAYVDGEPDTGDLSSYRLILHAPAQETSLTSDFDRTQPSGNTDAGLWSVENGGTVLRLIPGNDPQLLEDWVIESFTPRKMTLVMHRNTSIKQGPSEIRFVLILL